MRTFDDDSFRKTPPAGSPSSLREALEEVLAESPGDRAACAAYADLLMEEGDPRGEIVQVQQRLEDPALSSGERKKLAQWEKQLLVTHQNELLGELAPYLLNERGNAYCHYRLVRGWLDTVHMTDLRLEMAPLLARAPQLRLLRELTIEVVELPGQPAERARPREYGLGCLASSPFLANVRVLRLGQDSDADDWMFPLGGLVEHPAVPDVVRRMPRLEELYLWADEYDLNELFALPTLGRLRVLKVYHVRRPHPLEVLAANPALENLTHLLLQPPSLSSGDDAFINLEGVQALVWSSHLPNLTHLQLRMSDMGDEGCQEIVDSGILTRLRVLDLRCGTITDVGAQALAECPDTRHLQRLNLESNSLTAAGLAALNDLGVEVRADMGPGPETYFYEVAFE